MLAVFNSAAFTNASGVANIPANATVEVRREDTAALASIYSDEAGTALIANPSAFADSNGRFTFYAAGIARGYSVKVTKDAFTYTLHNVAIGTAGQIDANDVSGFPALTAKGDSWWATAANTLAKLAVGAAGSILMARPAATPGVAYVAALNKSIYGLTYDNGTDAVNDLNINPGGAMDATGAYWMTLAAALGKQSDVAWAVGGTTGTPLGGLDTGAVGNSDYYVWLIARSDTGVVDALFSLSSTAPTMPANYDFKRLIGWFKRVAGTIVAFKTYETEGGGLGLLWTTPTLDINLANTLTTARRTDAVKVPLNFPTVAHLNAVIQDAAANVAAWLYCPDQTDIAPSSVAAPLRNIDTAAVNIPAVRALFIKTSATGTVAARSEAGTIDLYAVSTMGFTWDRRT